MVNSWFDLAVAEENDGGFESNDETVVMHPKQHHRLEAMMAGQSLSRPVQDLGLARLPGTLEVPRLGSGTGDEQVAADLDVAFVGSTSK